MDKKVFIVYVFVTVLLFGICIAKSQTLKADYQFQGNLNSSVSGNDESDRQRHGKFYCLDTDDIPVPTDYDERARLTSYSIDLRTVAGTNG